MLGEAKIIIPNVTNDGRSNADVVKYAGSYLGKVFGGCHAYKASGFWTDPKTGISYDDPCDVLVTGCEDTPITRDKLLALAAHVCKLAEQEAIYLKFPNGEVVFVDKPEAQREAA
jgi:hypothetical protein